MKQSENKTLTVIARVMSIILLAVVGITALLGGSALIIDPSGQLMNLNVDGLIDTMFSDYRAPGIILFLVIGVLSSSAAILVVGNFKSYPTLIFYQGLLLTGWIMAQIYLLPEMHYMQAVYGLFGVMLMLLGSYLSQIKNKKSTLY